MLNYYVTSILPVLSNTTTLVAGPCGPVRYGQLSYVRVLAFSCIYRAFGFLPSYLHLTHYEPTRIHSFLPFLLTDYN